MNGPSGRHEPFVVLAPTRMDSGRDYGTPWPHPKLPSEKLTEGQPITVNHGIPGPFPAHWGSGVGGARAALDRGDEQRPSQPEVRVQRSSGTNESGHRAATPTAC